MILLHIIASLMLVASTPLPYVSAFVSLAHQHLHKQNLDIVARDEISTGTASTTFGLDRTASASVSSSLPCDKANGTDFLSNDTMWTVLCDTDFLAQDIYPFILAKTFEECMRYCEDYNVKHSEGTCAGFVFAPDRIYLDNSCYLKSGLKDTIAPATIHLVAATIHPATATSTIISPIPQLTSVTTKGVSSTPTVVTPPKIGAQNSDVDPNQDSKHGQLPTVTNSTYLGTSIDEVASQYVSHAPAKPQQLSADMLEAAINVDLIAKFPLASDTGTWTSSDSIDHKLSEMSVEPRLSRDGGRGGNINGTNVFIFCDTSTYGKDKDPVLGYLNGFVSSSVAVDYSMDALNDKPLSLTNSLGQWQDDVGRLRGWVPMTTGEEAFNIAVSGRGYRYAVWPNASPIALNNTHSIMHAPLVYLEVDMQDQSSPSYTSLGNTLLLISVDDQFGPHADRIQNQFFLQNEVNWGSLGGIRAWSSQGQDSLDGYIYVFGQAENGILIGKVAAHAFKDRDEYTYWDGHSWSHDMPPTNSTSDAFMIDQPVMNMDIIYSPAHRTFIMIYLTPLADNTFYYRYLISEDGQALDIIPPYEDGGDDNYVEAILTKVWSPQEVLFVVPSPDRGYAYAGGLHAGYFGEDDITNGGIKILCTWTEHTKVDPEKPESGYAHKSQVVELGFQD